LETKESSRENGTVLPVTVQLSSRDPPVAMVAYASLKRCATQDALEATPCKQTSETSNKQRVKG